jgi:putative oxidoreductase
MRKIGIRQLPVIKPAAFAALWLALIAQSIWMAVHHFRLHESWGSMWYPLTFAVPFLLLACTNGRVRWIASILRLPIAIAFLEAVSDRFGLLGGPGSPGVAWGDFSHFIRYTAQVNSFMPRSVIPALAVMATVCEITFGATMLFGIRIPSAAIGSSALLFLFATAMTISGLPQFSYGVYVMAAGALALSTVDASLLSVDGFLRRRKRKVMSGSHRDA